MSRLKKFTRSLFSGYLMLGANIFYTFASVSLALHYLGKFEFGLWALVSQLSSYMLLLDFGMSGSVARILIDHKDHRHTGDYGSVIKTGALAGAVQGALIMLTGIIVSFFAGALLHVPNEMQREFFWLMSGQSLLMGFSLATRIFSNLLVAHQRADVTNFSSAALFFLNLAVMWSGFAAGWGIYSFIVGQAVMAISSLNVNLIACMRLHLLPRAAEWGNITFSRFNEIFTFGGDMFLRALGTQLISASQAVLLTRLFGLETAATWNICTRTYMVLMQVINRIIDFSAPALAEMMACSELELLHQRFRQIATFSFSLAVAAGAMFALNNGAFVSIWTHGRIAWPIINDLLLAIWLVIYVDVYAHTGLAGLTKKFHFLRYIFFIEGMAFIMLTIAAHRWGGITAMLIASIFCSSCCSLPYGFYRTRQYFGLARSELAGWHLPGLRLALWLLPIGLLVGWLTHKNTAIMKLCICGGGFGVLTLFLFFRFGLDDVLFAQILARLSRPLKLILSITRYHLPAIK